MDWLNWPGQPKWLMNSLHNTGDTIIYGGHSIARSTMETVTI